MIPFTAPPSLHIYGPITIHAFGVLVATGVLLGIKLILKRAAELGIPEDKMETLTQWCVIPGFIGAHVFEILLYQPERLSTEGLWVLFKFWDGLSSYGGFIGGLLGFLYYTKKTFKQPTLFFADIILQGLLLGMVFGRFGCTVAFDHPGAITDFFLGFQSPEGARHNLGLYEFLFLLTIVLPASLWVHKKKLPMGYQTATICLLYAPTRFLLDFFRATDMYDSDARYFGLTPAHYCSILLFAYSSWLFYRLRTGKVNPKVS
jgi:phosphatidylglycerol:prolipoprotein diacylglycerol transferase